MSADIIPLRPRTERTMTHEHDDSPVSADELAAWAGADVIDTSAYDDTFFDQLAADIERAVAEEQVQTNVVPLRPRRRLFVAVAAIAAAILLGVGLTFLGGPSESTPVAEVEDPTPSLDDLARSLGASALADVLGGADEDEDTTLFASRDWLEVDTENDTVPTSYGSLLEELDDVDDYDTFFPL